jgi:hypothetical protein
MSFIASPPIDIDCRHRTPHRFLGLAALGIGTCGVIALLCISRFALGALAAGGGVLITIGLYRHGWLRHRDGLENVTWTSLGEWVLTDSSGKRQVAQLRADSRILPGLILLRWSHRAGQSELYLFDMSLPPGVARRLRARLHLEGCRSRIGPGFPPCAIDV